MADSSTPSVVILGTDAVLAARPATAVQLAHACLKAGYRSAIPASWGDELLATEALHHLADPARAPTAVYCVCPLVVGRLGSIAQDPSTNVVALVSPPLATARYVRTLAGDAPLHITFVGGCPDAADREIDARYTPEEFLARLSALGITPIDEPLVFDSILPADRRRFRSLPGGVPSAETLWSEGGARALAELDQPDFIADLAQRFLSRERTLIDVAARLGCVCSGAIAGVPPLAARAAVSALEPPRATNSVVDESLDIPLLRRLPRQRTPAFAFAAIPAARAGRGEASTAEDALASEPRDRPAAAAMAVAAPAAAARETVGGETTAGEPDARPAGLARESHGEGVGDESAAPRAPGAPGLVVGTTEPALEIPEAPETAPSRAAARSVPTAASPSDGRPLPRAYLLRRRGSPRGVRALEPSPTEASEAERAAPVERERTIPSDVEPHPGAVRGTSGRTRIVTGPVPRSVTPAATVPAVVPPAPPRPPAPGAGARRAAPPAPEPMEPVARGAAENGRTMSPAAAPPPAAPAAPLAAPAPPPSPGAEGASSGAASPADALIEAWMRLARERPLLQLGVMLAAALVFGLLFALLFTASGDGAGEEGGRGTGPAADSAVVADSAPGVTAAPPSPDSARRAAARTRPAASVPASRRATTGGRAAADGAAARAARSTPATPRAAAPESTVRAAAGARDSAAGTDARRAATSSSADSVAAARAREIEALREEFARRRARLDSLNRRVDSLSPPAPPAAR